MIRLMTILDYDQVYALWLSCQGMGLNNYDDSREGIERFLQRNPQTCFVAEEDGQIVGVVMSGHDGRRGFLYHTAVHHDYRCQGLATLLVKEALGSLKKQGISKVALVVFERNEGACLFWEKQGFVKRDDIVYWNKALIEMVRKDT